VSSRPDFGNNSALPDFGGELFLVWRQAFCDRSARTRL